MARDKADRPDDIQTEQAPLSVAELRQLITLMNGSDIDEIGIEEASSGLRLALRKPAPITVSSGASADDEMFDALIVEETDSQQESTTLVVTAPLVGVFRAAMKAGGRPLSAPGDVIREGQIICAVEALNVYNEVEAPAAGRLSAIYVDDGQPVEYGQPLLEIEPLG
ncbi:MAG TPA: acetyl-CoA carboxylase biotin carboxyl carrier protein subunit [Ktedonobacterales bacterium]|jgi:biotin carboxyl carrier protein|nr:acetyl-CoA carboxylase biotin carboxyl carrier protein subunit [Ktedonobacterales bacterium]